MTRAPFPYFGKQRAESRVGAPWDRSKELAGLRRRQQEINERLAATPEPSRSNAADAALPAPVVGGDQPSPPSRSEEATAMSEETIPRSAAVRSHFIADPQGIGL